MPKLVRLSLSIEEPLFKQLERMVKERGYTNRSEYVRDMIREQIVQREWEEDRETFATLTLVYRHHKRGLSEKLTDIQHHHHESVLASTHVHLDEELCAEVILLKGIASGIRDLANRLRQQKGVLHASLTFSSTGEGLD